MLSSGWFVILISLSVTIILVIVSVYVLALSFKRSFAVILGSNIGTTMGSQIYTLVVDRFALIIMPSSLLLSVLCNSQARQQYRDGLFFLGLLLLGLNLNGAAVRSFASTGQRMILS
jgi:phosphate:Na+ symporter